MARKEKKYHYIYKTTNIITGRYYYGMHSTDNLNDNYIGSGKRLWFSIRKYGRENHLIEILEFFLNRTELKERERILVNKDTIKDSMCMNIKIGGEGGLDGLSEESIKRIRKGASEFIHKMRKNPDFLNKINKLSGERMRNYHKEGKIKYDTFTGKKHTNETKIKMSVAHKGIHIGEKNSRFGTCWITKDGANKSIKKENLQQYVNEGWSLGRVM